MAKAVFFGEVMLRLSPPDYGRFVQADYFQAFYGGAEANAALSFAQLGENALFVSKLPAHEIGQAAINSLRRFGVDVSSVVRGGNRLGLYYCEKGASQRGGKVLYDRAGSAFALSASNDYDWDKILCGAEWFVFSGITPALGGSLGEICTQVLQECRRKKVKVCFDLNYRSSLWSAEKARRTTAAYLPYTDLLVQGTSDFYDTGVKGVAAVARALKEKYGVKNIAMTLREGASANKNSFTCLLYSDGTLYRSHTHEMHIVDRIGGGDACTAALVFALMKGYSPQRAAEFGAAAAVFKHTVEGDANLCSLNEILALTDGKETGRVSR